MTLLSIDPPAPAPESELPGAAYLRQHALRLQSASRALMRAQEAERHQLARELHDAVGQELAAISLNLSILGDALPVDWPAALSQRWTDTVALLEQTARHVRAVMMELRPPGLDELGLLAALEELAAGAMRSHRIEIEVSGEEPLPRLAPEQSIVLFRIVQEAIKNSLRHAGARTIEVTLSPGADHLELCIVDDGCGFDTVRHQLTGSGLGMATMRERAMSIGASLRVSSRPGRGTRVHLELPHAEAVGAR